MAGYCWNTLSKTYINDKEKQFYWEDKQLTIFDLMNDEKEDKRNS